MWSQFGMGLQTKTCHPVYERIYGYFHVLLWTQTAHPPPAWTKNVDEHIMGPKTSGPPTKVKNYLPN